MTTQNGTLIGLALLLGAAVPALAAQTVPTPEPPPATATAPLGPPPAPAPPEPSAFPAIPQLGAQQPSGWLGFTYSTRVERTNGERETRLVVSNVRAESPAGRAGMREGDEIRRVNGIAATPDVMRSVSRALEVGDTVRLSVRRDAAERQLTLVAERRPAGARGVEDRLFDSELVLRRARLLLDSALVHLDTLDLPRFRIEQRDDGVELHIEKGGFPLRAGRMRIHADSAVIDADGREIRIIRVPDPRGLRMHLDTLGTFEAGPGMFFMNRGLVGAELTELSPELARHFQGAGEGLLVLRVAEGTPAARAGLQAGDVVVRAGDDSVTKLRELQRTIARSGGEPLTLEIVRDGRTRELRLPARDAPRR